tara:strand:- start:471 stop:686 length:216 start_codon:yes stop_codon:yes gene_type:complete
MDDIYLTKLTKTAELSKIIKSLKERSDEHQKLNGELRKELDQVKKDLALEKEDHQYDNLVHKKQILEILKK